MERVYESSSGNGPTSNGHMVARHSPYQSFSKGSLRWLDIRVFYVRVSKCETDDESTPTYLTLNHVPLNPDTLLEVNGVRTGIYSDGASTLLRRDRVDKKSEEATFVSTDTIRLSGSVKFEVFIKDALLLSGVLELCEGNGCTEESRGSGSMWSMNCESAITSGTGFLKAKQYHSPGSASPTVEVYVAGSFSGNPIILTRTLQPSLRKKQMKGMLDSIPEYEATEDQKEVTPLQIPDYLNHKSEGEEHGYTYSGVDYFDGEDGELSWFNAGVRVGVGIGLSICVGIGLGVGLLVRTYQGTTRNFRRRLL
ncbi:erythronate-4phosphate dehydrogenase [Hibiscus trionum]|uniref:Erythronate-4phosphate dehydrogenase n=1 Tax=Hibiscus trionum TaxID=183268 RepID=A0A9W7HU99_HIBTR|nr:erythronate-4phosphate dehydrogenase [Hibiscus trionum]